MNKKLKDRLKMVLRLAHCDGKEGFDLETDDYITLVDEVINDN